MDDVAALRSYLGGGSDGAEKRFYDDEGDMEDKRAPDEAEKEQLFMNMLQLLSTNNKRSKRFIW